MIYQIVEIEPQRFVVRRREHGWFREWFYMHFYRRQECIAWYGKHIALDDSTTFDTAEEAEQVMRQYTRLDGIGPKSQIVKEIEL